MKKLETENNNLTTRIIPGLTSEHQIVSMPYWAWFWLEDFMASHKISFQGIYETFHFTGDIHQTLQQLAELHQDFTMREVYNLSNDNEIETTDIIKLAEKRKDKEVRALVLPKIYKLFGFMSCATTLDAVWNRKNYPTTNKVN